MERDRGPQKSSLPLSRKGNLNYSSDSKMHLFLFAPLLLAIQVSCNQWTCTVTPSNSSSVDDAPAIIAAFAECNLHKGKVILTNTTYYINSVMNITGLKSVDVDIFGTMVVSFILNSNGEADRISGLKISHTGLALRLMLATRTNPRLGFWEAII